MMDIKSMLQKGAAIFLAISLLTCSAMAEVDNPYSEDTPPTWQATEKAPRQTFPDVPPDASYAEAVNLLADLGIVVGDGAGNYNPNATISRAETAAIICRMLGAEDEAKAIKTTVFNDVPANHWAVGYVAKAAELGIIDGYGNGNFGPSDPVTYEQMVKMLICAWGYEEEAQAKGGWPQGYWSTADTLGILGGVSAISTSAATRSMVAVLCCNTLNAAPGNFLLGD